MKGKRFVLFFLISIVCVQLNAQDANTLMQQASVAEKQLKESEALAKYEQATQLAPGNMQALVKCTELNCSIGARQKDAGSKTTYYNKALTNAQNALKVDSNSADAYYAMALVAGKMTEITDEKKEIVDWVRKTKIYADKALALKPDHAMANYVEGKWHYEMTNLSWIKKTAVKALYGGLPKGDIDSAISYMEKCQKLNPYFVRNYFDLAKAYEYAQRPQLEINILKQLVRLPNRTQDDAGLKEEGQKMLDALL